MEPTSGIPNPVLSWGLGERRGFCWGFGLRLLLCAMSEGVQGWALEAHTVTIT